MKQKSLVLLGKQQLKWITNDLPALEKDEILIRTIAGAISIGAELPQYNESDVTVSQPKYPKQTGYENYGEIIEIGEEVRTLGSPAFYEKELMIVGSSDGWDYIKHAGWFFEQMTKTPYINKIFEHQITVDELVQCFASLSYGKIKALKVLVTY